MTVIPVRVIPAAIDTEESVRARMCDGKTRHATKRKARDMALRLMAHGRSEMSAYRCFFCRAFHVGHRRVKMSRVLYVATNGTEYGRAGE